MGAVVVALVAVVVMLLGGVAVAGVRLVAAVRRLLAVLDGLGQQMAPMITELQEQGEIASIESAALQDSIAGLGGRRR